MKKILTARVEHGGMRLDVFLKNYYKTVSRTNLQRHIGNGLVLVNGAAVKSSLILREGDSVEVSPLEEPELILNPEPVPFSTIYYDEHIIVIDKPSGVVVHPGSRNVTGTLVNGLLYRFGKLPEKPDKTRPGIVHRLDKDTSGVMVAARTVEAHAHLKMQFKERTTEKEYVTLVHGIPRFSSNIIDAPIGTAITRANSMKMEISAEGKEAVTRYKVVEEHGNYSLVSVLPKTGRTHQIRLHMAHIGHPVLCDPKYGRERVIPRSSVTGVAGDNEPAISRLALHAKRLKITHPATEESMTFTSEIPSELTEFIELVKYYEHS